MSIYIKPVVSGEIVHLDFVESENERVLLHFTATKACLIKMCGELTLLCVPELVDRVASES